MADDAQKPRDTDVLPRPPGSPATAVPAYTIHARDKSVDKRWRDLTNSHGGKLREYYDHLSQTPTRQLGERIFPMKGKRLAGIWEAEVGGGARLYYQVDEARRRVTVTEVTLSHRG